jgi:acyl-CoA dehydrogenase
MDFTISDKTQDLLERIGRVVREDVIPLEGRFLAEGFAAVEPALGQVRARVKERGLWGPQIPSDLGGMGLSLVDHGLVSEVLGRSPLGHFAFGAQAPDAGNLEILHRYGTAEQKTRWLEPLARGELRSCFSMTEPETPGSNPTQLACRAVRDGDSYVLDGRKWFTSSADGAAFAIVMAVTNPDAAPHQRASQIIVPTDTPGFRRVRNISVMGHPGSSWASHAEVVYEKCRVPVANLLGPEGAGFLIAQERLGPGRIHHCMRWIGICERAFDLLCTRAVTRRIDDEMLGAKGIVQMWIAESRARIDAARLMVLRTAWKIDHLGFAKAQEDVSLIKFFTADVLMDVLDRAIQAHGALGITDDLVLAHWYAHERGARIYDGPDETHKVSVARRILKRYGR